MTKYILAAVALAASAGLAFAAPTTFDPVAVPEIDVLAGGAAVAVAGATLALIRHRAKR